jgi:hypothetical protein
MKLKQEFSQINITLIEGNQYKQSFFVLIRKWICSQVIFIGYFNRYEQGEREGE